MFDPSSSHSLRHGHYVRDAAPYARGTCLAPPSDDLNAATPPDVRPTASRGRLVASKPRAVCGETPSADARAGATLARCQAMTGRLNVVSAMTALACTSRSTSSTARERPSPRTLPSCTRSRTGIARACFIGPAPRTLASRHPAERSPRCPLPIVRQVVRPVRSDDADRRAADQSERRCALGSTMTCRPARALRVIATASLADSASTCTLACRLASFKP